MDLEGSSLTIDVQPTTTACQSDFQPVMDLARVSYILVETVPVKSDSRPKLF